MGRRAGRQRQLATLLPGRRSAPRSSGGSASCGPEPGARSRKMWCGQGPVSTCKVASALLVGKPRWPGNRGVGNCNRLHPGPACTSLAAQPGISQRRTSMRSATGERRA